MGITSLIGKAKELEIARQLTEEGLLVFLPLVDEGVDLVVTDLKMRRFLPIQVKFRETRSGLGVYKKDVRRLRQADLILAFIVASGPNQGTWYIPLKDFMEKKIDPKRKDEYIYIQIDKRREWLKEYKEEKGIKLLKSKLKQSIG